MAATDSPVATDSKVAMGSPEGTDKKEGMRSKVATARTGVTASSKGDTASKTAGVVGNHRRIGDNRQHMARHRAVDGVQSGNPQRAPWYR